MKKLKAPLVNDPASTRENKRAIDGVYKALAPDYLMILGAIDVVPHQDLKNPLLLHRPATVTTRDLHQATCRTGVTHPSVRTSKTLLDQLAWLAAYRPDRG